MMMWTGWYGMHAVGAIMMLVFWGVIVWGLLSFIRTSVSHTRGEVDASIQILRERYAHGDISEEEYKNRLAVLRK